MDACDWLLRALADEGVTRLFGNPGSTELPLIDALPRQDRVRYVLGLHEAAVMGMADGWAQAGGGLAAVNVHVQPGIANALSGILNAARARVPLLVTVGQQVTSLIDAEPFLGGDVVGPSASLAKHARETRDVADLPRDLADCVRIARTPPCGPVVLSLPLDVQVAPAPPVLHTNAAGGVAPEPSRDAVEAAARLIGAARAPVVLAGDGVAHAGASHAVAALAERLGAPVWGEPQAARAPLPWSHRLWQGQLPPFGADIRRMLAGHDVVIALGMPVFRLFGWSPGPPLPEGADLVHVDVDAAAVGRSVAPAVGIVADPGTVVARLGHLLGPRDAAAAARAATVAGSTIAARRAARRRLGAASGGAITPADLSRAVAQAVMPRDLLVDEGLTSTRDLRTLAHGRGPVNWLAHRGSSLGWGLPAAVGAAMARPGRRVLVVQGDGSLVFGAPALWTAARERVPLALVVADNGGYEILRAGMEGLTGHARGPWPGLTLPGLDVGAICAGFGASVEHVADPAELGDAMAGLWRRAEAGPAVLVARVAPMSRPVGYPLADAHVPLARGR